jgi:type II secretory pathway pseudopilin PulG
MTRFLSLSIRKQLLLIVLVVAVPAAAVLVYSSFHTRDEAVSEAKRETQQLADIIASEQRYRAAAAEQLLRILAQLPEVKAHQASRVNPLLSEILKLHTQYSNIFITDLEGSTWASALPAPQAVNVADRRYFRNAVATGRLSSGEYLVGRFTRKSVINLAYPYRDRAGRVAGVIVLGFDLDYYRRLLSEAELASGKSYLLLDHQGTVLARAINPEELVGKRYPADQFREMVQGPDERTIVVNGMDKRLRFISYRKLRLDGEQDPYMYIRVGFPVDTVLAQADRGLMKNLALFFFLLATALGLAWLIGKRSIADRVALL